MPIMFRTALISMFLTSTALADTWTVDDDGKADFNNIQAAIDAASDGDEIVVMPGTYTSTQDGHVVNMLGKAVTLRSSDPSDPNVVAATIIDGEGARRGIACFTNETEKTVIVGFTITNGFSVEFDYSVNTSDSFPYGEHYGGGMHNRTSNPTLVNCTFENNTAEGSGGGMCNIDSSPTLLNCTFENNTAEGSGGGMYGTSLPTVPPQQGLLRSRMGTGDNSEMRTSTGYTTLTDCAFSNNIATSGGAIAGFLYNTALTNCTFTNNTAEYYGGGMLSAGSWPGFPILTGCTFDGNTAESGGGMATVGSSSPTIYGCTFIDNVADIDGGGMHNGIGGNPMVENSIFTGNSANYGGGISNTDRSGTVLTNNTVCGNTPDQIYGPYSDGGGNTVSPICPMPGVCCTNGLCLDTDEENDCIHFGGQWLGEGTTCEDNACPESCLGDLSGDGQVNINDLLILIAVWGTCP